MLEGTQIPSLYQTESNQCLFEINTKDPRLNLGPVSYVSLFELESDFDMCLDLNLNYAENSNEFVVDFSLPTSCLSSVVAPTNKLNVLPDSIDFSEMLSFKNQSNSNPIVQSAEDSCNSIEVEQEVKGSDIVLDMKQISDRFEKNVYTDDIVDEPQSPLNYGLLSGILMKSSLATDKCKANGRGSEKSNKSSRLSDIVEIIMNESKQNGSDNSSESLRTLCSDYIAYMKILSSSPIYNTLPLKKNDKLIGSFPSKNKVEKIPSEACIRIPDKTENVIFKEIDEKNVNVEEWQDTHKVVELIIERADNLERNKENSLKSFHGIVDANEIQKSGVQIFRKPTKLFVFDSLKKWKKQGEGQITIWKLDQSDNRYYYLLLWDRSTNRMLIHMRLDSKWGIDYLPNSRNSCRWSHFNYANCPEGVRERLACRFRDSEVAAQFLGIVAKCVANSRQYFK